MAKAKSTKKELLNTNVTIAENRKARFEYFLKIKPDEYSTWSSPNEVIKYR